MIRLNIFTLVLEHSSKSVRWLFKKKDVLWVMDIDLVLRCEHKKNELKRGLMMRVFFGCAVLLGVMLTVSTPWAESANSQEIDPKNSLVRPVIAIVDVQRILEESLAAKSVQKQLETQRSKFQTEIEKEENDLRQSEQELSKSHDQLPTNVYAEREQQLRQRFLSVERHVQARRKVLDQAFTDSMNTVRSNLSEIVEAVAHQHGANIVIVKQQALWADKSLDVTDEVLGRLNKRLPQVTVTMGAEDKP